MPLRPWHEIETELNQRDASPEFRNQVETQYRDAFKVEGPVQPDGGAERAESLGMATGELQESPFFGVEGKSAPGLGERALRALGGVVGRDLAAGSQAVRAVQYYPEKAGQLVRDIIEPGVGYPPSRAREIVAGLAAAPFEYAPLLAAEAATAGGATPAVLEAAGVRGALARAGLAGGSVAGYELLGKLGRDIEQETVPETAGEAAGTAAETAAGGFGAGAGASLVLGEPLRALGRIMGARAARPPAPLEPEVLPPEEPSAPPAIRALPAPEPQPIRVTPEGEALMPGQERPLPPPPGEPSAEQEFTAEATRRFAREHAEADAALRAGMAEPPGGPESVGVQPEEMPAPPEAPAVPPSVTSTPLPAQTPQVAAPAAPPAEPVAAPLRPTEDDLQAVIQEARRRRKKSGDLVEQKHFARQEQAALQALEQIQQLRLTGGQPPGEPPAGAGSAEPTPPPITVAPAGMAPARPAEPVQPSGGPTPTRGLPHPALRLLAAIRENARVVQTGANARGEPLGPELVDQARRTLGELLERAKAEGVPLVAPEATAAKTVPETPQGPEEIGPEIPSPISGPVSERPVPRSRLGQAGAIFRRKPRVSAMPSDPDVAAVLTERPARLPVTEHLRQVVHRVRRGLDEMFGVHEPKFRDMPAFRNDLRLAKDTGFKGVQWAEGELTHVIGDLDRGGAQGEYELFRNITVLADMADRAKNGQIQPGALSAERYGKALDELIGRASPEVKTAWERHVALMRQLAEEEVRRGKLHPSVLEKAAYYPHQVIDLADVYGEMIAGLPRSLKEPFLGSRQRAMGSEKPFELNYADAMYRHLVKLKIAWATDDFALKALRREDVLKGMSPVERAGLFGVRADGRPKGPVPLTKRYTVNGQSYVGFQYQPFQWGRETPANLHQAIVLDAAYRPSQRVYLVPEKMAKRLQDFHRPKEYSEIEQAFRQYAGSWKRLVVDLAGLRFFYRNIPADLLDFYREDAGVLGELVVNWRRTGRAVSGIAGREAPEGGLAEQLFGKPRAEERPAYEAAQAQDVIGGSTFFGPQAGPGMLARRRALARLSPGVRVGGNRLLPLEVWERAGSARESALRVASFLRDYDRITAGKPVIVKAVDIQGLDPINAAGKKARETAVDYAKTSPAFDRGIRTYIAPFSTWYLTEISNWSRYLTKHPVEAAAKLGAVSTGLAAVGVARDLAAGKKHETSDVLTSLLPLYGLWYWNNHVHAEVEKNLPEHVKSIPWHINTGYQTEDGKPLVYVPEVGMDTLTRAIGVERLPHLLGKLSRKEITRKVFLEELLDETALTVRTSEGAGKAEVPIAPLGPFRLLGDMSPLYQVTQGLLTNQDPFTRRKVVSPPGLVGTPTGNRMMVDYLARELVPAYGKLAQALQNADRHPGEAHGLLGRLAKGLLDHGPLDPNPFHALEVPIDLQAGKIARGREAAERAKLTREESLYGIERGVIVERAEGKKGAITKAIAEARQAGVPLTRDDVLRRMKSFRFQRGLAEAKLHAAPDAASQERARQALERIKHAQAVEGLKKLPKTTRGAAGAAMR